MKKFALILLIGIYSAAVFGVGTGFFTCCHNSTSAWVASPENSTGAITAIGYDCDNTHGTAFSNHHIAAASIHFASRNFYSIHPHIAFADFATIGVTHQPLPATYKSDAFTFVGAVPFYILHCVYRI